LRLGLEAESWSLVAYASNLTNEVEYQSVSSADGLAVPGPNGLDVAPYLQGKTVNRPRSVGAEFTYHF